MKTKLNLKQILFAGLLASASAIVVNAILFFIFRAAGIITDTIFIQPNQPLTLVPIIISSLLPTLIASLVFFLFEKYSTKGFKYFQLLSIVLLILSFINPFVGIPEVTTAYAMALNLMHVVVVLALFYFIKRAYTTGVETK